MSTGHQMQSLRTIRFDSGREIEVLSSVPRDGRGGPSLRFRISRPGHADFCFVIPWVFIGEIEAALVAFRRAYPVGSEQPKPSNYVHYHAPSGQKRAMP